MATADGSEREICPTLGTIEEMARFQMEAADAGLVAAQAQLDMVQMSIAPKVDAARAGVLTAVANRDAVEAQLDLALAGARSEEINVAEAGVAQARVALAQARELLALSRIEAPFDAVLTDLPVEVGDTLAQGATVATLATLDRLQLRTTDLTELDAVNVVVSAPACRAPCTVPAAPASLCSSTTDGTLPQRLGLPSAAQASAHSPIGEAGVIG